MFEHDVSERYCACGAPNPRARAKYCRACGAAASRRSYANRKGVISLRRQKRSLSAIDRAVRNARAYLAMYVKRGKVAVEPCETCGLTYGRRVPLQEDPQRPLEARWFCPPHYRDYRMNEAAIRAVEAEEAALDRGGGWRIADPQQYASKRECFEHEYPHLPAHVQAALRDIASRKIPGVVMAEEAPMFRSALISVFDLYYRGELQI